MYDITEPLLCDPILKIKKYFHARSTSSLCVILVGNMPSWKIHRVVDNNKAKECFLIVPLKKG